MRAGARGQPSGKMAARDRFADAHALLGGKARLVLDVGANRGAVTRHFRTQYPEAVVHAFEPIPSLADELRQNFAQDSQVIVHGCAVGAKAATVPFHVTRNLVSSSLYRPSQMLGRYHGENVSIDETMEVPVRTLSDLFAGQFIDLLKLDIQGGELQAFIGAGPKLLSHVHIILTEVMFSPSYEGQDLFADVDAYLRGSGFRLFNLYDLYSHPDGQLLQGDALYVNGTERP
ncbi:FkbM family methyltransferase [Azospirillum sp. SYSU D00513]|uniref:FkbM family methyltransferase n=1 Tax=Azospirillum sp. SYSU D00513 TaxID=2812561 RepID=UPI001A9773CC|nr:FkbM family methyltransferase [Azospirillum sp. SYSU D00513]